MKKTLYVLLGIAFAGIIAAFVIPFLLVKKTPPIDYTNSLKIGKVKHLGITIHVDGTKERVVAISYDDSSGGAVVLADSIYYNSLHIGDTVLLIEKIVKY